MTEYEKGRATAALEIILEIAFDDYGIRSACRIITDAIGITDDEQEEAEQAEITPAAEPAAALPAAPIPRKWDAEMLKEEFATAEVESVSDAVIMCIDGLNISTTELAEITGLKAAYINRVFLGESPAKSVVDYFSALLPALEGGDK